MSAQGQTLSIIINNYNHDRFVGEAITSALAFAGPVAEVIVVDDGSTDQSRSVICSFSDRITPLFLENRGQLAACVEALALASGDYVYFLDADDMVRPGFAEAVRNALSAEPVKVQFQLQAVDALGSDLPSRFPTFPHDYDAAAMRSDMQVWGQYVSPPTSGNIFSRRLLDAAWRRPIEYERAVDGVALYLAPFAGPVASIAQALASYRLHGTNLHQQHVLDPARMERETLRVKARLRHLAALTGDFILDSAAEPGICLENTVYARVARREPVIPTLRAFLPRLWCANFSLRHKVFASAWAIAIAASPKPARLVLCRWRLSPLNRPRWMNRLMARRSRR